MNSEKIQNLIVALCLCAVSSCAQAPVAAPRTATSPAVGLAATLENLSEQDRALVAVTRSLDSMKLSARDGVPPIVIRFSGVDSKAAQEMEEDLAVMGYLVDQAIDEPQSALGIDLVFTSGGRSVRGMYIEGVGALYMIKVNFPVLGSEATEEKPEQKPADSEWEKAKQALRGQGYSYEPEVYSSRTSVQFDPKQVEALKKVLLTTMKNGANFRHLKPDDYLSFAVFGHPSPVRPKVSTQPRNAANDFSTSKSSRSTYGVTWSSSSSPTPGTVLTLKARKSDIDAFAKGSTDLDAFSKKVITASYAGNGYGITSVNSWLRDTRGATLQVR
jgi:hypothetical protein